MKHSAKGWVQAVALAVVLVGWSILPAWAGDPPHATLNLVPSTNCPKPGESLAVQVVLDSDVEIVSGAFYFSYDTTYLQLDEIVPPGTPWVLDFAGALSPGYITDYGVVDSAGVGASSGVMLTLVFTVMQDVEACDLAGIVAWDRSVGYSGLIRKIGSGTEVFTEAAGNLTLVDSSAVSIDVTAPVIDSCSPDQVLPTEAGCAAALPDFATQVVVHDNCDATEELQITQSPAPGTQLTPGPTLVSFIATDTCGNVSSACTITVTVADDDPPVIDCAASKGTFALQMGAGNQPAPGFEEWIGYPSGWWNVWFPNEYDPLRKKVVYVEFDVLPTDPASEIVVALNWSDEQWTDTQSFPVCDTRIERYVLEGLGTWDSEASPPFNPLTLTSPIHVVRQFVIPFCPAWVSVDVFGGNFTIENGVIWHECISDSIECGAADPAAPSVIDNCDSIVVVPPYQAQDGRWSEGFAGGNPGQVGNVVHAWSGSDGAQWELAGPTLQSVTLVYDGVNAAGDGYRVYRSLYDDGTLTVDSSLWGEGGMVTAAVTSHAHESYLAYDNNDADWAASYTRTTTRAVTLGGIKLAITATASFEGQGSGLPTGYPPFLVGSVGQWGGLQDARLSVLQPGTMTYWDDTQHLDVCSLGIIKRFWVATDRQGNASTCLQAFERVDTVSPTITCPSDITTGCDQVDYPPDPSPQYVGWPIATDVCDAHPEIYYLNDTQLLDCCHFQVTRWFYVEDCAGNQTSCGPQIITLTIPPPDITWPLDKEAECGLPIVPDLPVYTNHCDTIDVPPPIIVFVDDDSGVDPVTGLGTILRTWTITPGCGDDCYTLQHVQSIDVVDTVSPEVIPPPDITIECDESQLPDRTGDATATDLCDSSPSIAYTDDPIMVEPDCPQGGGFVRWWTAVDDAGNASEPRAQTISIVDTTSPVLSCPSDVETSADSGSCGATVPFSASATDNCDPAPIIIFYVDSTPIASPHFFPVGTTLVTVRGWDHCGNEAEPCQFSVVVTDDEEPTIQCPADIHVNVTDPDACEAVVTWDDPIADNCPGTTVDCDPPSGTTFPVGTSQVCCTATDAAGNEATCCFNVIVTESVPPELVPGSCPVDPEPLTCGDPFGPDLLGRPEASDNCPGEVVVFAYDTVVADDVCHKQIKRDWYGRDQSQNVGWLCEQYIDFDAGRPTQSGCPGPVTLPIDDLATCTAHPTREVIGTPSATGASCSGGPNDIAWTWSRSDGLSGAYPSTHPADHAFASGNTTIVWTGTDQCGQTVPQCPDQVVTVAGTVPVEITVNMGLTGPFPVTRCMKFEFSDGCPAVESPAAIDVTFTAPDAVVTLDLPCKVWTCVTAEDELHTLRRQLPLDSGSWNGLEWVISFTGGNALLPGDILDDGVINALDFGLYVNRVGVAYTTGDTLCGPPTWPLPPYHADLNGDGSVSGADFLIIVGLYNQIGAHNCCGTVHRAAVEDSFTYADLIARGLAELVLADLNRDGVLDIGDLQAYSSGAQPWVRGDVNNDGRVDTFDIEAFVLALTQGEEAYYANHPDGFYYTADANADGRIDTFDIDSFVRLLTGE